MQTTNEENKMVELVSPYGAKVCIPAENIDLYTDYEKINEPSKTKSAK